MQGITKKQSNNWPIRFTKMQNSCNFTLLDFRNLKRTECYIQKGRGWERIVMLEWIFRGKEEQ